MYLPIGHLESNLYCLYPEKIDRYELEFLNEIPLSGLILSSTLSVSEEIKQKIQLLGQFIPVLSQEYWKFPIPREITELESEDFWIQGRALFKQWYLEQNLEFIQNFYFHTQELIKNYQQNSQAFYLLLWQQIKKQTGCFQLDLIYDDFSSSSKSKKAQLETFCLGGVGPIYPQQRSPEEEESVLFNQAKSLFIKYRDVSFPPLSILPSSSTSSDSNKTFLVFNLQGLPVLAILHQGYWDKIKESLFTGILNQFHQLLTSS